VCGRLRVRGAALEHAEAAVAVLVGDEPGCRAARRGTAATPHRGERLQDGAGHVGVARGGAGQPEPTVGVLSAHEPPDCRAAGGHTGPPQGQHPEGGIADEAGDRAVMTTPALDLGDQVPPAEAARAEARDLREQGGSLDRADVAERAWVADHVARERTAAGAFDVPRVPAGRAEAEPRPTRVEGARAAARGRAEAAVLVLRLDEVGRGLLGGGGGTRGGRDEEQQRDGDDAEGDRGRRALPAHLEPAAVARERSQEGGPYQEAEDDVARRVREVVGK